MFPEQKLFKKIQIELCCLLRYLVLARFHVDFEEKAVPECIATNSNYLLLGRQEGIIQTIYFLGGKKACPNSILVAFCLVRYLHLIFF